MTVSDSSRKLVPEGEGTVADGSVPVLNDNKSCEHRTRGLVKRN